MTTLSQSSPEQQPRTHTPTVQADADAKPRLWRDLMWSAFFIVAVLAIGVCSSAALAQKPEKPVWGEAVQGVQARLVVEKEKWEAGKVPKLTADFRNRGKMACELDLKGSWMIAVDGVWYHSVFAGSMEVFGGRNPGASSQRKTLGPGEELTKVEVPLTDSNIYLWIHQTDRFSPVGHWPHSTKKLEFGTGKHTVRIRIKAWSRGLGQGAPALSVFSNEVEIETEKGLPGSRQYITYADRDEFVFAAVCKALDDPRNVPDSHPAGAVKFQTFEVLDVFSGSVRKGDHIVIRYVAYQAYNDSPTWQERPLAKGESVIWIGSTRNPAELRGVKAVPDTPEYREILRKELAWGGPAMNGLRCRLLPETQTVEIPPGTKPENVKVFVTYELRNIGEKPVKFLPWGTPLEGEAVGDSFAVFGPDGKEVQFIGANKMRGRLTAKNFITVEPGQSMTQRVALPYDFSRPGTYQVCIVTKRDFEEGGEIKAYYAGNAAKIQANKDHVWTGWLYSNTVAVKVLRKEEAARDEAVERERLRGRK